MHYRSRLGTEVPERANVAPMTVAQINASFDTQRDQSVDPVLWEIRRERRIELMGEGFRFNDLKRWMKANKNIIMFLCGHVKEGYREEVFNGYKIPVYMSDYQGNDNGGNGVMRTFKINTVTNEVSIRTFSPYAGK